MSNLTTLPKGDSAWLFRKAIERIIQQISVLETNIGSSTTGNSANNEIIFNDDGVLRGDADFIWNKTLNLLTVTGSANITADLTVDTSTLYVSSSADKVGIGTTSLSNEKLTVAGNISANAWLGRSNISAPTGDCSIFRSADNTLGFGIASSPAMTLNSTGLGVGGSPAARIHSIDSGGGCALFTRAAAPAAALSALYITAPVSSGFSSSTVMNFWYQNTGISNPANECLAIRTSGADRLYIDASGNCGIGVTPSAWNSGWAGGIIQFKNGTSVGNPQNGSGAFLGANVFRDASGNDVYISSDRATRYRQQAGQHQFFYDTGTQTVGANASLTQAMTLDASGNLLVGTTTSSSAKLDVQNSSADCTVRFKSTAASTNVNFYLDYVSGTGALFIRKSGTDVWQTGVLSDTSATPNYKIQNSSGVGVQLVSGATAWTTLSDETIKDIIEPISNALTKVGSLRSVIGKFKTDNSSKRRSFLIAQDVQSVLPEAVDVVGENNELGLRYTEVIPLLVAAIKELTARVQTLETR